MAKWCLGYAPRVLLHAANLLYINDLPINVQGADDTNIQIKATNEDILNKKINRVMQQLLTWFRVNGLVINTEKTIALSFHVW